MKKLKLYPASAEIERKIEDEHGVALSEVEEVFQGRPLILRGETD